MQTTFETPVPTSLHVELDKGSVAIRCDDVTETTISVEGTGAEEAQVEWRGDHVAVIAPRRREGLFHQDRGLDVQVRLPHGSELSTTLASADLTVSGRLGVASIRTGSGDVRIEIAGGDAHIQTGSGEVRIADAHGAVMAKSGSGLIDIGRAQGAVTASTGSGDVVLGVAGAPTAAKSGSGNVRVDEAHGDLSLKTATGDLTVGSVRRGQVALKNATGDIHLGVVAGVPVWTDVQTVTGSVTSTLEGAGRPEDGQDYVELRAKTVSGDIRLEQL